MGTVQTWSPSEWAVDSVGNAGQRVAVSGGVPTGWSASAAPWQTGRTSRINRLAVYQAEQLRFCPMSSGNVGGDLTGAILVPTTASRWRRAGTYAGCHDDEPRRRSGDCRSNIGNSGSTTTITGVLQGAAGTFTANGSTATTMTSSRPDRIAYDGAGVADRYRIPAARFALHPGLLNG